MICKTIKDFKEEKGGKSMCKLVDDYAKEYAEDYAENLIAAIQEMRKGLSEEELKGKGYEQRVINHAKLALG